MGLNANKIHAQNFSLGGAGPIDGYYEIRTLLQNKTNHIDTIFISYGLRHLLSQDCFYTRSYYFNFIPSTYLDSARQTALSFSDKNYSLPTVPFLNRINNKMNNPSLMERVACINNFFSHGFHNMFEYLNKLNNHQTFDGNNQFINGRLVVFPSDTERLTRVNTPILDDELLNTKPSMVNELYLKKIFKLATLNHHKVIFILMPTPKSKIGNMLNKQVENLHTIFENSIIVDTIPYKDSFFRDAGGHLNISGVDKFQSFLQNKLYRIDN
jgi:hypothetical protein